ncbi:MAG: putative manganese-dependent inorganic diphosphatase [Kiritimatiellae bacterium]|nr:putative manganese-dependent inorganic diphosphatase [Kiritimatiellia bacterium]MDW8458193.1 putative manganese-dependent inorganic diphosphatase [Verrucomicrobiota bacterium]
MSAPLLVIGHKNPDTDAICAAIGYAWFLAEHNRLAAEAACCGEINARTQCALQEAGLPPPRLVMDVRPTIADIAQKDVISAQTDEPLYTVYRRMLQRRIRVMPVLDAEKNLRGLISFPRLMELVLPEDRPDADSREVETSLRRLTEVLGGSLILGIDADAPQTFLMMVAAMSARGFTERMKKFPPGRCLIVTGDRPTIQTHAIEYGVRAIVVTGGYSMADELLENARERGVSVVYSPHDTATTTLLIRSAKSIRPAIETEFARIPANARVDSVAREVSAAAQDLFPVMDDEGRLVGVFSKSDLVNPPRARLILVDHNELSQAVTGADQAEILEVIDHHRLGGGLTSREPIRFINEPVGSTCTIIGKFLMHRNAPPPRPMALCLAAGIISDTLLLRSPTSTHADRTVLDWLAEAAAFDPRAFAEKLFAAGSVLELKTPDEAVAMDCKEYAEMGWRFAVAQIEELDLAHFAEHRRGLQAALAKMATDRNLHFAALMVTDITHQNSLLLVAGDPRVKDAIDYPELSDGLFQLDGVVSRKKQLLPHIMLVLSRLGTAQPA